MAESDTGSEVWQRQRRQRAEAQETIWFAQLILWLPLFARVVALGFVLFAVTFRRLQVQTTTAPTAWAVFVSLLFPVLYWLAGRWVGLRQSRGVWLGIALFGWSLATAVWYGRLLSFTAGYALLGLALVVRAGRAIGIPQLRP